eukprot:2558345-Prymnesium_polylepis.1
MVPESATLSASLARGRPPPVASAAIGAGAGRERSTPIAAARGPHGARGSNGGGGAAGLPECQTRGEAR